MNPRTGEIYEGQEIDKALGRGEPIVPVSERVAALMRDGQAVRTMSPKQQRRLRSKASKRSRKRNRR